MDGSIRLSAQQRKTLSQELRRGTDERRIEAGSHGGTSGCRRRRGGRRLTQWVNPADYR
jgi:hypothetical protein